MAFTGKFFISGSFSVIYTYTAELFPTTVRTIGLGLGSLGGGLGGVIAPYILSLQVMLNNFFSDLILNKESDSNLIQKPPVEISWLPTAIFSGLCVGSAFLLLILPETRGRPLYETMAMAEKAWTSNATPYSKGRNKESDESSESSKF